MIKACIFDLDGVIVDTALYHFLAWKRLADELGIPFTEEDNEQLKGISRMDSLKIILDLGHTQLDEDAKRELSEKKNEWFVEYVNAIQPNDIFPGVKPLIKDLRAAGIKVALASSSKNAKHVIRLLEVDELFDAIVDGTMVKHSKPDPEIFLLAAKLLGVEPAYCLVFEDAEAGVEAAKRAGMKCVGIGDASRLSSADLVYENTGDFLPENLQLL